MPSSFRPLITIVIEVYWPAWLKLVRSAHRLAQWQKFNVLLVSVNPFKGIICGLAQHVLNWANFFFANLVRGIRRTWKKFGEHSWFLIGWTFPSEYSTNCDEAMFGIQRVSLNIFWEYSPSSANLGLWLVESKESSPVDEEEITIKMDDGVHTSLSSEGTDILRTCGMRSLVSETQIYI